MRTWRVRLAVLAAAFATAAGASVAVATPANASAQGCAWWGTKVVAGIPLPAGQYCFGINGSGTRVNFTSGSINTPAVYNRSETVRFYNMSNSNYATFNTSTVYGRSSGFHYWQLPINGTAQVGRVCGQFKSSGVVIAEVCHRIY